MVERGVLLVLVAALAVVAAIFPFARAGDWRVDRTRPMYSDLSEMAWLQQQHISSGGRPVPVATVADEPVSVGSREFTPTAGVEVEVKPDGPDGFCVRASNQYGDQSPWTCYDSANPAREPAPS